MKLPDGREINGWWLVAAVLAAVVLLSLVPRTGDLQEAQQKPAAPAP